MNLQRRLKLVSERIVGFAPAVEEPASSQWLAVLKAVKPWVEQQPNSPERDAVLHRIVYSIELIEVYLARQVTTAPWAYLEYYCRACVYRLSWTGNWVGREFAFMEPDYDEHMREIEKIERVRR